MNDNPEDSFKRVIQSFYLTATKNHQTKYTLKNRFKKFLVSTLKQRETLKAPPSPKLKIRTTHSIQPEREELPQMSSMRIISSKEAQNNLSVSKSRSRLSRSNKASSRDISENDGSLFNCEWVYRSQHSSHTLMFAIMSSLVLNDNKVAFKYFEDKVNDHLLNQNFTEHELITIGHNWQRIGDLLMQSKSIRWRKILKEAIDKFPINFSKFTCRYILSIDQGTELVSPQVLHVMSRQLKITLNYFSINFRDIEHTQKLGNFSKEIFIGKLTHNDVYVVASKMPQYSKEQLQLRAIKSSFQDILTDLVQKYQQNQGYMEFSDLMQGNTDKEEAVREHFRSKIDDQHW